MIQKRITYKTSIAVNTAVEGETIEEKVERIISNQEGIEDTAEMIYTDRREGVKPEFNIRTDRWDIAAEMSDYANRSKVAKREEFYKDKNSEKSAESESTQATE